MATMKDVAQKAGVGVGTVSRVINHVPGVKESTLNKVDSDDRWEGKEILHADRAGKGRIK